MDDMEGLKETYGCPACLRGKRLVALDIETTGLDMDFNSIIELGVVEVNDGKVVTKYSRLFGGGRSPMHLVLNVHRIKDSERAGLPTFEERGRNVAAYIGDAIVVTHNGAKFDVPFMERKLATVGERLKHSFHIDTYLVARQIRKMEEEKATRRLYPNAKGKEKPKLSEAQSEELPHRRLSLGSLCAEYGIPYGEENHRGLLDCWCTLQLLYAMCGKYGEGIVADALAAKREGRALDGMD